MHDAQTIAQLFLQVREHATQPRVLHMGGQELAQPQLCASVPVPTTRLHELFRCAEQELSQQPRVVASTASPSRLPRCPVAAQERSPRDRLQFGLRSLGSALRAAAFRTAALCAAALRASSVIHLDVDPTIGKPLLHRITGGKPAGYAK